MRPRFANSIKASSRVGLHPKAGHRLLAARTVKLSLARRGPSTHEAPPVHHAARRRGGMAARGACRKADRVPISMLSLKADDKEAQARISVFAQGLKE